MRKIINKITKDSYFLKGTIGVMLCLLALFGALNTGIVSQFFTWIISFFFGWFFYVFYLILFLVGIKLILAKKNFKLHFDITIFGIIILLIGCLIIATNSMTYVKDVPLTFTNFFELFKSSVQGFPIINYSAISGGFIGYLFVAILNSGITYVGTQIVGSIFICSGIVLSLIKTVIRLIKSINDYKNRKIKKVDSAFKLASDQTAFDSNEIKGMARTTTVITPDSDIPKENTQSIAIQNPNGGVGVGLTSINRQPTGLVKAKFDPNATYMTTNEVTHLNDIDTGYTNQTQPSSNYKKTTSIETIKNDQEKPRQVATQPIDISTIPIAKKAQFDATKSIYEDTLKVAQEENEVLDGADVKITKAGRILSKKKMAKYVYPPIDLLSERQSNQNDPTNIEVCKARMEVINQTLKDFNIGGKVISYTIGPSVTRYNLEMNRDQSGKAVERYVDDIASRLKGISTRYVQVVPGKTTSGFEIANKRASLVNFKDCLAHLPKEPGSEFMISFGKDISGDYIEADLINFPHLLVCGTTGSGKSVFLHNFLMTLIMRNKLDNLSIIIIDPKRVEFNKYKGLPFLLCPPVTEADEAVLVLNKLSDIMDERFDLLEKVGVENLKQYNKWCIDHEKPILPRIVVLIDEYADLVSSNKQVSFPVVRLAQKARAAGIHLVIATQRPSTNVITGVIKANIPTRVALLCSGVADSVVILSSGGAEKLLGNGDMLVQSSLISKTGNVRVQGSYVDNTEICKVVEFLKNNYPCDYDERFCDLKEKNRINNEEEKEITYDKATSDEEKYNQIREDVMSKDRCSISMIQRLYGVGFPRAGKIFARLVEEGVLSDTDDAPGSNKGRIVLKRSIPIKDERKGSIEQSTFTPNRKG